MAAVPIGERVEYRQMGDVTVGERRELVYVEDEHENAALVEKKTTVAQVPLQNGTTAVLTGVEYSAVTAGNDQQRNGGGENGSPYTQRDQRIADSATTSSNPPNTTPIPSRPPQPAANQTNASPSTDQPTRPSSAPSNTAQRPRPPPPAPPPQPSVAPPAYAVNNYRTVRRTTYRPPNTTTALIVKVQKPWDKCQHYFIIVWMLLALCLGLAGLSYVGIGARAHTCDKKVQASDLSFFELWASSFATGAVLIAYTLCLWLSCMAYCVCCKRKRDLCIGVVIGCGIIATFFFIILAGFNANAVGLVVDTPTNSTLHNEDCFSPYWLAYIPPFAFGAVVLAFIFSLFCCLCCKLTFHVCCSDVHRYARL